MTTVFRQGEYVVYPTLGLAEVTAIEALDVGGFQCRMYTLRCLESTRLLRVPVAHAAQLGIRAPATPSNLADVWSALRAKGAPEVEPDHLLELVERVQSGDLRAIAEVVGRLHQVRRHRPLTQGERRVDELALRLLVQELAHVQQRDLEATAAQIEVVLG